MQGTSGSLREGTRGLYGKEVFDMDMNVLDAVDRQKIRVTPDGRARRRDAAAYLGVSEKALANWASGKKGPRFVKVGGRVFYHLSDLDAFIRGQQEAA
jgi:hypothetical protein